MSPDPHADARNRLLVVLSNLRTRWRERRLRRQRKKTLQTMSERWLAQFHREAHFDRHHSQ